MNDIIDLLEKYKKTTTKGMEHDFQKLKSIPVDRIINSKQNRLVLSICMTTFVIILTITIVLSMIYTNTKIDFYDIYYLDSASYNQIIPSDTKQINPDSEVGYYIKSKNDDGIVGEYHLKYYNKEKIQQVEIFEFYNNNNIDNYHVSFEKYKNEASWDGLKLKYKEIYSINSGLIETNVVLYLANDKRIFFEFKNYENISIEEMMNIAY
ncbi:MAG: hypothetical protein J5656_03490 [Clostridia bacterium]|nr:hypothetical protein [Clostridia bacterium]